MHMVGACDISTRKRKETRQTYSSSMFSLPSAVVARFINLRCIFRATFRRRMHTSVLVGIKKQIIMHKWSL